MAAGALAGIAAYAARKELIAKWLDLPPAHYDVGVERNLDVPMDDGVLLRADHYYPDALGAFPTILIRTPYGRGFEALPMGLTVIFWANRVAERGYHVIVQNTRGRFDSEGKFYPFLDDERDGLATMMWIEQQSWFNGELGTWGPSYLGFTQWAPAAEAPASLNAMVPIMTASQPAAYYPGGAFILDTSLRWVARITSENGTGALSLRERFERMLSIETRLARAVSQLPLTNVDENVLGQPVEFYRDWVHHPPGDRDYWGPQDYSDEVARVTAPAHFVAGWYDFFLHAQLYDYQTMIDAGDRPFLTIGPWTHVDPDVLRASLREALTWFDAHLKHDRSRLREKPVRLYVMSADGGAWRDYEAWPPPADETRYYLHARGRLSSEVPSGEPRPDRFTYDPVNPTPSVGGAVYGDHAGPADNRELEARDDVLVYTTPPLDRDVEVIGPVRLELYVRSSTEHTDFFGRLCDVYPDGRSINICDGLLRLEPATGERLADGRRRIVVDMWATAYRFKRGHRIRLQVSSGAHPRYNRNLGTGEPLATGTRMVVAEQTVYHDAEHPSALVLPIVKA